MIPTITITPPPTAIPIIAPSGNSLFASPGVTITPPPPPELVLLPSLSAGFTGLELLLVELVFPLLLGTVPGSTITPPPLLSVFV